MAKYLEFEELSPFDYVVKVKGGDRAIGYLVSENNGTFLFHTTGPSQGGWESYMLREIADKIDELDKPFFDSVDEYFKNNPPVDYPDDGLNF